MNELCHQVKSYTTSNEAYTYKHMLQKKYCKEFFNSMLEEIEVHEKREHWALMNRNEMHTGEKQLWKSGPSSASGT